MFLKAIAPTVLICSIVVSIFLAVVAEETQPADVNAQADKAEIERRLQVFVAADIAGNHEVLKAHLTEDVVWMPPGDVSIEGQSAVLRYLQEHQAPPSLVVTPINTTVCSDVAFLRGVFTLEVDDVEIKGKMVQQWRRQSGMDWKIASDIWNFNSYKTVSPAGSHPELSDALKPLQFLVGDWVREWESDTGDRNKVTFTTTPDADGHVLLTSGRSQQNGKTLYSWYSLRFDKGRSQGLTKITVTSHGARDEGSTVVSGDSLVTRVAGISPRDEDVSFEVHFKVVDNDTLSAQRKNIVVNGEPMDNWPVGQYRRAK